MKIGELIRQLRELPLREYFRNPFQVSHPPRTVKIQDVETSQSENLFYLAFSNAVDLETGCQILAKKLSLPLQFVYIRDPYGEITNAFLSFTEGENIERYNVSLLTKPSFALVLAPHERGEGRLARLLENFKVE